MNRKKSVTIIFISILILILTIFIGVFIWYNNNLKPVNTKSNGENSLIRVEIEEGMGSAKISTLLKESNIIRNATVMKIYLKINNINGLQAGTYNFNNQEDMKTIIQHLVNGDVADDTVKITFIEGKNMRWIAKKIAEKTINSEEDVFELLKDKDYIDSLIEKYWFLTDDIKDENIYYPLEGYLLPDTYTFENDTVSVKSIFNLILSFTEKYLEKYRDEIENSEFTIHEIFTLASITELEGKSLEDREEIIGVFLNRMNAKMSLGSDVTTYYAFKIDMGERDLTAKELNTENAYNTRGANMSGKLPIGPICNPSKLSIEAVLNYKETDAFYFVADKNGKVYFTKNREDHIKMINKLKKENLWYVYE